ncbi:MAG: ATP-dependent RecD-like DNA helicase [Lachnospiraceae bacterium]|nr:ATP-dependent RecD-like DNA helicase [Lachnospiraceae bacterium]
MAEIFEGFVERIVYRNDENGYTVLNLVTEDDEMACVGNLTYISEGEYIKAKGDIITHQLYGEQLKITEYEVIVPKDSVAMERYLASGAIKGIKESLAHKIVSKFKDNTFYVIENEPERLAEIKGISEKKARDIAVQFEEKREMRNAMIFLQQYNISNTLALKIYSKYGYKMYDIIKENPYKLAEDITGVGFKIADDIAIKAGINYDSEYRIRAGVLYELNMEAGNGNVFVYEEELFKKVLSLLEISVDNISMHIDNLAIERKVILKEIADEEGNAKRIVYSCPLYYAELNVARMLHDLNIIYKDTEGEVSKKVKKITDRLDIELDEQQYIAVVESVRNGITIITGGPGTGKTTTINTIIKLFDSENLNVLLAAPTGRAAKRMSETTGRKAQTIHRLLEISGSVMDEDDRFCFGRNEENPLEADVIIVDEMSMVDINLMNFLLKAITIGTRLILVGDVNQLPSVGPGNVLKDIIASNKFNVVKLNKIFRQASESDIIVNAHKINNGESINLDNKSKDFFMAQLTGTSEITSYISKIIKGGLAEYIKAKPYDIQVLAPMRKGELGVEKLNIILQEALNPPSRSKNEKEVKGFIFRENDKVMQIKNNYQMEWEIRGKNGIVIEKGQGIFNGDMGIITSINTFAQIVEVLFDDNKTVTYTYAQLEELEHAYAVTIHKSQGSEYPAVILPLLMGPKTLMNRNLLYTAVTRAKKCVTIVGTRNMVQLMIDNISEQRRNTTLTQRIVECTL